VISSLSQLPNKLEFNENLQFWFPEDMQVRRKKIGYSDSKPVLVAQQA
jgi:hypothetical protein